MLGLQIVFFFIKSFKSCCFWLWEWVPLDLTIEHWQVGLGKKLSFTVLVIEYAATLYHPSILLYCFIFIGLAPQDFGKCCVDVFFNFNTQILLVIPSYRRAWSVLGWETSVGWIRKPSKVCKWVGLLVERLVGIGGTSVSLSQGGLGHRSDYHQPGWCEWSEVLWVTCVKWKALYK